MPYVAYSILNLPDLIRELICWGLLHESLWRHLAAGADPEGEKARACARHWRWPGTVVLLRDAAGQGRSPEPKPPSGTGEEA